MQIRRAQLKFKGVLCKGPGYAYDFAKLEGKQELVIVKKFNGERRKEVKTNFKSSNEITEFLSFQRFTATKNLSVQLLFVLFHGVVDSGTEYKYRNSNHLQIMGISQPDSDSPYIVFWGPEQSRCLQTSQDWALLSASCRSWESLLASALHDGPMRSIILGSKTVRNSRGSLM